MNKPFRTLIEEATEKLSQSAAEEAEHSALYVLHSFHAGASLPNELLVRAFEALESIAAFHLVCNPICEPEDAIHIVVNDTEIAREAVIQIISKLEGVSK